MYICICKGLTENQLTNSIQKIEQLHGYVNINLIQMYTGASTKCGCCKEQIQEMFKQTKKIVV